MNEVAGVRDIRRRIRSVRNTMQITKAMKMVSAAKVRKAQEKVNAARPYARQLQEMLARLAQGQTEILHPLMEKRPVRQVAYVVLTTDRGQVGGYNANIIRQTTGLITEQDENLHSKLISVGRKGRDFFRRTKNEIVAEFVGLGEEPNYQQSKQIAQTIIDLYVQGQADEVYLVFAEFISIMTQRPTALKLLPLETPESKGSNAEYIFEPSASVIIDRLLPQYIETQIFRALLEAKAGEHGARMTAMGSATDNANEMIARLTLIMNRARQAAITTEISEIVGGAAALE